MSLRFLQHIFQYHADKQAKVAKHRGRKKAHHQGPKPHHTATTHVTPTADAKWNDQAGWKK